MATKKKTTARRYTAAEKAKIVKFVRDHNAEKGRGGQNTASKKFNISPITIAKWLKEDGGANPAAAKPAAKKSAKKAAKKTAKKATKRSKRRRAKRYSDEQKQEILQFVAEYNEKNGRGGQSVAARKFSVSPITLMQWAKTRGKSNKPGKKAGKRGPKKQAATTSSPMASKLDKLQNVHNDIVATEKKLAALQDEFNKLKNSL